MPDNLSLAFERLRTSTERLNQITDAAAQAVRDVESFLEEAGVGLFATVPVKTICEPEGAADDVYVSLEYRRVRGGKYRIAIAAGTGEAFDNDAEAARPWAECTREEKLEAFEKLPELLVALSEKVIERTSKAESVLAQVSSQLPKSKKKGGA